MINISNHLTSEGIKRIYKKLFDPTVYYNEAFFSSITDLLKLRAYTDSDTYVESISEEFIINDNKISFIYKFEDIQYLKIVALRIFNGDTLMMELDNFLIQNLNASNKDNVLNYIELYYELNEVTQCIPNKALLRMTESLVNLNGYKITALFIGDGQPDLSGNSSLLTSKIASYEFYRLSYNDNYIRIVVKGDDNLINNDITEMGVGYLKGTDSPFFDDLDKTNDDALITDEDGYQLCTIQSVSFDKMDYSGKYIIELIINII